jgi:GT2 family glycosyltransferase
VDFDTAAREMWVPAKMPGEVGSKPIGSLAAPGHPECVDCAIVIVTYNSERHISGLLRSLPAATAGLSTRTVVVDNNSADGTVQLIRDAFPDVVCVEAGANVGYAAGINLGRAAVGDYSALLVLNPDIVLDAGAIRNLFASLDDDAVGMAVPMLLDECDTPQPSLRRDPSLTGAIGEGLFGDHLPWRPGWLSEIVRNKTQYLHRHSVDWATGAVLLISAACDKQVGQWDEQFFMYSEEIDYAYRARAAGFRIEYVPAARARHEGAGSGQSADLVALLAVNRVRYMEKMRRYPRLFRAAVILHELLRSYQPSHRAALRAVLRRSTWPELLADLKAQPASSSNNLAPVEP